MHLQEKKKQKKGLVSTSLSPFPLSSSSSSSKTQILSCIPGDRWCRRRRNPKPSLIFENKGKIRAYQEKNKCGKRRDFLLGMTKKYWGEAKQHVKHNKNTCVASWSVRDPNVCYVLPRPTVPGQFPCQISTRAQQVLPRIIRAAERANIWTWALLRFPPSFSRSK